MAMQCNEMCDPENNKKKGLNKLSVRARESERGEAEERTAKLNPIPIKTTSASQARPSQALSHGNAFSQQQGVEVN